MAAVEEKLRLIRWPFDARAEIFPQDSGRILTRVTEISLHGCYVEFTPLQKGSHVLVKIFAGSDFFEAGATVIFPQPNVGLGLTFRDLNPYFLTVLKNLLTQAMKDKDK